MAPRHIKGWNFQRNCHIKSIFMKAGRMCMFLLFSPHKGRNLNALVVQAFSQNFHFVFFWYVTIFHIIIMWVAMKWLGIHSKANFQTSQLTSGLCNTTYNNKNAHNFHRHHLYKNFHIFEAKYHPIFFLPTMRKLFLVLI